MRMEFTGTFSNVAPQPTASDQAMTVEHSPPQTCLGLYSCNNSSCSTCFPQDENCELQPLDLTDPLSIFQYVEPMPIEALQRTSAHSMELWMNSSLNPRMTNRDPNINSAHSSEDWMHMRSREFPSVTNPFEDVTRVLYHPTDQINDTNRADPLRRTETQSADELNFLGVYHRQRKPCGDVPNVQFGPSGSLSSPRRANTSTEAASASMEDGMCINDSPNPLEDFTRITCSPREFPSMEERVADLAKANRLLHDEVAEMQHSLNLRKLQLLEIAYLMQSLQCKMQRRRSTFSPYGRSKERFTREERSPEPQPLDLSSNVSSSLGQLQNRFERMNISQPRSDQSQGHAYNTSELGLSGSLPTEPVSLTQTPVNVEMQQLSSTMQNLHIAQPDSKPK